MDIKTRIISAYNAELINRSRFVVRTVKWYRGELIMRDTDNNLGRIIKDARKRAKLTQGKLAENLGVGERHISGIENEGKNPGYDLLYDLIRELKIDANTIFFPERESVEAETDYLISHLHQCNKRDIIAITAFVEAMMNSDANK